MAWPCTLSLACLLSCRAASCLSYCLVFRIVLFVFSGILFFSLSGLLDCGLLDCGLLDCGHLLSHVWRDGLRVHLRGWLRRVGRPVHHTDLHYNYEHNRKAVRVNTTYVSTAWVVVVRVSALLLRVLLLS
jgi:hypothetical protein